MHTKGNLLSIGGAILLFVLSAFVFAQEDPAIENGKNYDVRQVSPFLHSLYEKNDIVIAFSVTYAGRPDNGSDDFILTRKANNILVYTFNQRSGTLKQLNIPAESLDLIWKTFIQNDIFKMRDESDIANFCAEKYHIYNSYTYEFTLLSKGRMKKLSYYAPEYYDEACYGMPERQKIINCAAVITYVLFK